MAVNLPRSPLGKQDLKTPHLPPVLHTRSGNELYDRPQTPTSSSAAAAAASASASAAHPHNGFTSPAHTPHGSPSKSKVPPGATELPNVFENAMKLTPSSPGKSALDSPSGSPEKGHHSHHLFASGGGEDDQTTTLGESVVHKSNNDRPESPSPSPSPTRKQPTKENAAPPAAAAPRVGKDIVYNPSPAAASRQEPYHQQQQQQQQQRERVDATTRRQQQHTHNRKLTADELEKLQRPNVKRLANVTQLCQSSLHRDLKPT